MEGLGVNHVGTIVMADVLPMAKHTTLVTRVLIAQVSATVRVLPGTLAVILGVMGKRGRDVVAG